MATTGEIIEWSQSPELRPIIDEVNTTFEQQSGMSFDHAVSSRGMATDWQDAWVAAYQQVAGNEAQQAYAEAGHLDMAFKDMFLMMRSWPDQDFQERVKQKGAAEHVWADSAYVTTHMQTLQQEASEYRFSTFVDDFRSAFGGYNVVYETWTEFAAGRHDSPDRYTPTLGMVRT